MTGELKSKLAHNEFRETIEEIDTECCVDQGWPRSSPLRDADNMDEVIDYLED
jgi:hypothetical protein